MKYRVVYTNDQDKPSESIITGVQTTRKVSSGEDMKAELKRKKIIQILANSLAGGKGSDFQDQIFELSKQRKLCLFDW